MASGYGTQSHPGKLGNSTATTSAPRFPHLDGEEAARRPDFQHALAGKIDVPEILIHTPAQVPTVADQPDARQIDEMVKLTII